jgi:hypothetical protein
MDGTLIALIRIILIWTNGIIMAQFKTIFASLIFCTLFENGCAHASPVYKWETPDGATHISDNMSPDSAKYGYSIVNPISGKTIDKTPPEKFQQVLSPATTSESTQVPTTATTPTIATTLTPTPTPTIATTPAIDPLTDSIKHQRDIEENQRAINEVKSQITELVKSDLTDDQKTQKMRSLQSKMNQLYKDRYEM